MKYTPAYSLIDVEVYTLAGVEGVEAHGPVIAGRWKVPLKRLTLKTGRAHLCEDFLNWGRSPQEIMHFTRRFGPFVKKSAPATYPRYHEPFSFSVADWITIQDHIRSNWTKATSEVQVTDAEVRIEGGSLTIYAPYLFDLIVLDFYSIPWRRRKRCSNPECSTPYFVAHHLRQNYCSSECAAFGQRAWKRNWWQESGAAWRASRRGKRPRQRLKKTKQGGSHGKSR